jgi:hypothetical protein
MPNDPGNIKLRQGMQRKKYVRLWLWALWLSWLSAKVSIGPEFDKHQVSLSKMNSRIDPQRMLTYCCWSGRSSGSCLSRFSIGSNATSQAPGWTRRCNRHEPLCLEPRTSCGIKLTVGVVEVVVVTVVVVCNRASTHMLKCYALYCSPGHDGAPHIANLPYQSTMLNCSTNCSMSTMQC